MAYVLVDAEGAFDSAGRNKSYVHEAHADLETAIRNARRQRQVQIIEGELSKGDVVYNDAVGRIYPRVSF